MIEDEMRSFIVLAESLGVGSYTSVEEDSVSDVQESVDASAPLLHDLDDLAVRLRAFMESEGGDFALGVEMGMQRAADMIENLIRRYKEGDPLE